MRVYVGAHSVCMCVNHGCIHARVKLQNVFWAPFPCEGCPLTLCDPFNYGSASSRPRPAPEDAPVSSGTGECPGQFTQVSVTTKRTAHTRTSCRLSAQVQTLVKKMLKLASTHSRFQTNTQLWNNSA